ncbi:hypothetical protein CsatA_023889 [Cannabis sativa]
MKNKERKHQNLFQSSPKTGLRLCQALLRDESLISTITRFVYKLWSFLSQKSIR